MEFIPLIAIAFSVYRLQIIVNPPYNNRAKTWKFNNDYVDPSDDYRHSKWLSMIEKRLKIARRLLNPISSVLIVTIDEREYIHLGCLLEEMFPSARMQMISSVINPAGAGRQTEFSRTDEYIFVLQFGNQTILPESREVENVPIIWDTLRRSSLANARGRHGKGACGPNQFYPIYVDDATGRIKEIGEPIMEGVDRFSVPEIPGCSTVFPVRPDGTEMNWGIKPDEAKIRLQKGYLRAGKHTPNAPQQYVISYVTGGNISDIEAGIAIFDGYEDNGSVKAYYPRGRDKMPTTNWNKIPHDAQRFGTNILTSIIGSRFDYPRFGDITSPTPAYVDCILFAANNDAMSELHAWAKTEFNRLIDAHRTDFAFLTDTYRQKYDEISTESNPVSKHTLHLVDDIGAVMNPDGQPYTNHLYVDPNTGIAKIKLNTWEDGVLREEMRRPDFVCWLRNVSRAQWALCLPYDYNGEKKGFYPDMMIVRKHPQYGYVVDVLEPHMPRYDDNLPKAKALAQYSKDEPHVIRLQLIHEKTDLTGHKRYVRLDLQKSEIREKVLASSTPDDLKNIFEQYGEFSNTDL